MIRRFGVVLAIVVAAIAAAGDAAVGDASLTFAVTSTTDAVDAKPGDGICRSRAGVCTLRAALNETSALASDGTPVTITLRRGTFALRLVRPQDPARDEFGGDLDLVTHAAAPPSLTITGAGAGRTVITQVRADRVFEVEAAEPVTISNLSIVGGHGVGQGGGVYNGGAADLTLRGVEIASSSADVGGGIYSTRPLTVDRSRVTDNTASTGGGIALSGHGGTLTGTTVSGNTAEIFGGGIWAKDVDSLTIAGSLVANNSVTTAGARGVPQDGGGILVSSDTAATGPADVHVSDTTIRSNTAAGGGGLAWQTAGSLLVERSLFAANTAELGGGIVTRVRAPADVNNTATFVNTTFSENAAEVGGALERGLGGTVLRAVTFAGNSASIGSGIDFHGVRATYAVASGTVLANDPPAQNCSRDGGSFLGSERLSGPGANIETGTSCRLQAPDVSSTSPRLAELADNGGVTRTRALRPGSPAIDRYTTGDCPSTDQRGFARPAGSACDIGAYESGAPAQIVSPRPLRTRHGVTGGNLTFVPVSAQHGLGAGDYRPCSPGPQTRKLVTGGYFESRDAQILTRGALVFGVQEAGGQVRFGNLFVVLDGIRGRVLALVAPDQGALTLFDVVGVGYGRKGAHGSLRLTPGAAEVLNSELGEDFTAGMRCGRLVASLAVAKDPGPPPPAFPPPPPPPSPPPPPPPPPPAVYTLRVDVEPGGTGRVDSRDGSVGCTDVCTATFASGTTVDLTATPNDGMQFDNWEGGCRTDSPACSLTITGDTQVTAKFKKK